MKPASDRSGKAHFGGSPPKFTRISEVIRARITRGQILPGAQLPTRVALQRSFRTTSATVQKALTRLIREGLVETRGRHGSFVAAHPPHLTEFPLVFPSSPATVGGELWSRLYATLVNQAAALSQPGGRRIIPFYEMDNGVRAAEYPRLLERVQSHQLAGIIFASPPFQLRNTPLVEEAGVPRVALMPPSPFFPHLPAVLFGRGPIRFGLSYWEKALDHFVARGRKRLGILTTALTAGEIDTIVGVVQPRLSARGLSLHPCGAMPFGIVEGARSYAHLLMRLPSAERPDALIVADDNLVEHAVAGLLQAGVRVGEDLDVVAHCNFPWAGSKPAAVKWLGFDMRKTLETCVDLLDRQRRRETVPAVTILDAVFEEELGEAGRLASRASAPASSSAS